jgi:hypothetical protein
MPLVEEVLASHRPSGAPLTLESIQEADRWARGRLLEAAAPVTKR